MSKHRCTRRRRTKRGDDLWWAMSSRFLLLRLFVVANVILNHSETNKVTVPNIDSPLSLKHILLFSSLDFTKATLIFVSRREQLHSFEFAETSDTSVSPSENFLNTNRSTFVFLHHLQRKSKDKKKNNECLSLQWSFLQHWRVSSSIFIIWQWNNVNSMFEIKSFFWWESSQNRWKIHRSVDGKNSSNCFLRTNHQRETKQKRNNAHQPFISKRKSFPFVFLQSILLFDQWSIISHSTRQSKSFSSPNHFTHWKLLIRSFPLSKVSNSFKSSSTTFPLRRRK